MPFRRAVITNFKRYISSTKLYIMWMCVSLSKLNARHVVLRCFNANSAVCRRTSIQFYSVFTDGAVSQPQLFCQPTKQPNNRTFQNKIAHLKRFRAKFKESTRRTTAFSRICRVRFSIISNKLFQWLIATYFAPKKSRFQLTSRCIYISLWTHVQYRFLLVSFFPHHDSALNLQSFFARCVQPTYEGYCLFSFMHTIWLHILPSTDNGSSRQPRQSNNHGNEIGRCFGTQFTPFSISVSLFSSCFSTKLCCIDVREPEMEMCTKNPAIYIYFCWIVRPHFIQ